MVAAVNRKEAFQFLKRTITPPTETNPVLESTNRLVLNRDIHFKEIHDIFLDRTLSPCRVTDEPLNTAFRSPVAWSPIGLLTNQKCLLVTITSDHRAQLYRRGREIWEPVEQLSNLLAQNVAPPADEPMDDNHSIVFTTHKTTCYLRATIAAAWSRLYAGNFAWLVTLQRSGHVAIFKIQQGLQVTFAGHHDLHMTDPSTLQLNSSGDELLLFVGSHHGVVKCWSLTWKDEAQTDCHLIGSVINEPDEIPVSLIDISDSSDGRLVVCVVKQHVLVVNIIQCDANGLQTVDQQFVLLPTLQITGFTRLASGNVICASEDYVISEIDLNTNDKGVFTSLQVIPVQLPSSPSTMLCRGFSSSSNGLIFFALENIKVSFNHLQCREPSNLMIYVTSDLPRVIESLTISRKMDLDTMLALESYKALYGSSWEAIAEFTSEDPLISAEPFSLHLMRWFALFKTNCCSTDRRVDRETQTELELRVEKVEIALQLRGIRDSFNALLTNREMIQHLTDKQKTAVELAKQFINHQCTADEDFLPIVQEIKKIIASLRLKTVPELCVVCQEPIAFERRLDGRCSNGHGALRCRATLLTCFDVIRTCRWCNAYYNSDAGLDDCILCGGPCA